MNKIPVPTQSPTTRRAFMQKTSLAALAFATPSFQHFAREMRMGVVVYSYIDHHLQRLVGAHAVVSLWNASLPSLAVENGRIVHFGTLWEMSPLLAFSSRTIRPDAPLALIL